MSGTRHFRLESASFFPSADFVFLSLVFFPFMTSDSSPLFQLGKAALMSCQLRFASPREPFLSSAHQPSARNCPPSPKLCVCLCHHKLCRRTLRPPPPPPDGMALLFLPVGLSCSDHLSGSSWCLLFWICFGHQPSPDGRERSSFFL